MECVTCNLSKGNNANCLEVTTEAISASGNPSRINSSNTHTQPFYSPFSGTTRVSQCQKKFLLDFMV